MQTLVFFFLMLTQTHADHPALQTRLTHKSLTHGSQMMSVWIQQKLKSTELPEVHRNVDIGIGTIDYTLSNMQIVQSSIADFTLAFVQGTGVSVKISHLSLAVTGSWATHFGVIHDSGSFDLLVNSINVNTLLEFSDDESARVFISIISCTADVTGVVVNFHGGASFIFQPFVSKFRGLIADMIRQQICPAVNQVIDDVEKHLQQISVNVAVNQFIYLSIPLMSSPIVTENSFQLDMKGEFYSISSPSEPPFSPEVFDLPSTEDYMMSVGLSEFFMNSAMYSYFSAELLHIHITDDMIPKSSPIHLNTSQFSIFIPQLSTLYPDMKMQVMLYASETPMFSFSPGEMSLHVPASAKFSAVQQNGTLTPLFRLDVNGFFSGNAQIQNQHLTAAFKMNNLTLTLGSSEIGDFKTEALERVVKMVVNMFVLPKLNEHLKTGVELPVPQGFSLSETNIILKNGFLLILTDVEVTSSHL
ncbi:bactericidal permeability-increasing protein [Triplophysa dalaica]|uniref:bactericidal permeability-increasing protein n=1 Tax=Triplophysa dalaica TaxID=1582913 RepID=UPI0024DF733D|nr:bactericidal permeability-increasing protein [Triplophysa dalaica]XP_056610679.1 bactericidal permeability-increasing protein [Triplophysa dalaica]XP_056610680.1 bactericidal permeability-increasing protein [Triplophysa dalaica]XP_056610681.1 bactericidal permeability-increasing protein [Triplophysa dalaica]